MRGFQVHSRDRRGEGPGGRGGEIYIKFSSLGNNQLEQFLLDEGAEPVVPGLTDFLIFKIYNRVSDVEMFGGSRAKQALCKFFMGYVEKCQLDMIGRP